MDNAYENITNPLTGEVLKINTPEGKHLLKQLIASSLTGGNAEAESGQKSETEKKSEQQPGLTPEKETADRDITDTEVKSEDEDDDENEPQQEDSTLEDEEEKARKAEEDAKKIGEVKECLDKIKIQLGENFVLDVNYEGANEGMKQMIAEFKEGPKTETEAPKTETEAPKTETEAPKTETEAPKTEEQVSKTEEPVEEKQILIPVKPDEQKVLDPKTNTDEDRDEPSILPEKVVSQ